MKNLLQSDIDYWRDRSDDVRRYYGGIGDDTCGVFFVLSPIDMGRMRVIASSGAGWEHVSVSRKTRCPNWPEMEYVKRLFFHPHEVCMQLHVAEDKHLSLHPYCLHIWCPTDGREIPLPPSIMVAPSNEEAA